VAVLSVVALRDGSEVALRPLEESDRERLSKLFYRLSPESVYQRFLSPLHDPSDAGLDRLLDLDHDQREAIAAMSGDEVVGVARYFRDRETPVADLAVLIEDAWQGRGLSLVLVERLKELARRRGIEAFTATILSQNRAAIGLVRRVFPNASFTVDGPEMTALMAFEAPVG
jgi:RimJ/RimL family protein N-acetyltransferase